LKIEQKEQGIGKKGTGILTGFLPGLNLALK
jgi:hypothetical protein